jgi:hypothetical protein
VTRKSAEHFGLTEREVFDIHYALGVAKRTVVPSRISLHGTADHAEAKETHFERPRSAAPDRAAGGPVTSFMGGDGA